MALVSMLSKGLQRVELFHLELAITSCAEIRRPSTNDNSMSRNGLVSADDCQVAIIRTEIHANISLVQRHPDRVSLDENR